MNREDAIALAVGLIGVIMVIGIFLITLNATSDAMRSSCCEQVKAQLTYYSCVNDSFRDCTKYMQGYYCDFGNGTQTEINKINCTINMVTSGEAGLR